MLRSLALLATLACSIAFVAAQEAASLQGKWSASYYTANGFPRMAWLDVEGDAGTWQTMMKDRNNHCIGRPMPVVIEKRHADGFQLTVTPSTVIAGCTDYFIDFKRSENGTFEGFFSDAPSRKVVLSRR